MPAVTVALWGAILADDEARRAGERDWRRQRVVHTLVSDGVCHAAMADEIWQHALHTFHEAWNEQHHTPGVAWCLGEGLAAHGLLPGPSFDALVGELETRALEDLPPVLPGAREALEALSARWPVAVLCDVQITPAPVLRDCLEALDLARFLDAAVFSDEIGASKPLRTGFRVVAEEMGVLLGDVVHIGPSEARDVLGAHAAGARALRLGAPVETQADASAPTLLASVDGVAALVDAR
jgi:FMN phosphatase YigB (HAD superfamily)